MKKIIPIALATCLCFTTLFYVLPERSYAFDPWQYLKDVIYDINHFPQGAPKEVEPIYTNKIRWSNTTTNINDSFNSTWAPTTNTNTYLYDNSLTTKTYKVLDTINHIVYSPYTDNSEYYDVSEHYTYDDHRIYQVTYDNDNTTYNQYMYEGDTYISYYITSPDDPSFQRYYEIYFVLPDGRSSYNLTREEIKGKYTIYDVQPYERNFIDDGKTDAMFHLDGNWQNDCFGGGANDDSNVTFVDGYFGGGLYIKATHPTPNYTGSTSVRVNINPEFIGRNHEYPNANPDSPKSSLVTYFVSINGAWSYRIKTITASQPYIIETVDNHSDVIFDEIRLLGLDYTIDTSTWQPIYPDYIRIPPSQPYDNNVAWSVPTSYDDNTIGVKTLSAISGFQVGGVRPTYPDLGYVFIAVDDSHVVQACEVWNGSQWDSCDGAIYKGAWVNVIGYNLKSAMFVDPDYTPPSGGGGDSDGGGSDNPSLPDLPDDIPGISDLPGNITGLNNAFNSSFSLLGQVPQFFAMIFTWLPTWVVGLMGALIGLVLVLFILKIIFLFL